MQKNLLAVVLGILLFCLLELFLWIGQFHHTVCEFDPYLTFKESVPFLVEKSYTAEKWLTINPRFKSYFNPVVFPRTKPPGVKRIFVLGESSTLGFPFGEQGSYSWFLKLGLEHLAPTHSYQVINLGAFGFASYRIFRVFKEILNYEPDLIVVMMGQNEFLEKREYRRSIKFIHLQEKLSHLKSYCLLKVLLLKIYPAQKQNFLGTELNWEKMSTDEKTRAKITEHFSFIIEQMVKQAHDRKIPLLLLTAPVNLKDFPPYHSVHNKKMTEIDQENWQKQFDLAKNLVSKGNCQEASPILNQLIEKDPEYAETWFLRGQCFYLQKDYQKAKADLEMALEKDAWQVRALPEFNALVLQTEQKGAWVLDLVKIFQEQSDGGIPGENLFYDHCHPRLEAQALIAQEILKNFESELKLALPENWETIYDEFVHSYQKSLPSSFWAQAYYNLAIELGVNMGLKESGKKYLQKGLEIAPQDFKLQNAKKLFP